MSGTEQPYQDADTEELIPGDPEVHQAQRTYLCVRACQGVDSAMLEMLGERDKNGKTLMQSLLERVTWTSLPAVKPKKVDPEISKAVSPGDGGKLPTVKFV